MLLLLWQLGSYKRHNRLCIVHISYGCVVGMFGYSCVCKSTFCLGTNVICVCVFCFVVDKVTRNCMVVRGCVTPVSYTHLDVYKRQPHNQCPWLWNINKNSACSKSNKESVTLNIICISVKLIYCYFLIHLTLVDEILCKTETPSYLIAPFTFWYITIWYAASINRLGHDKINSPPTSTFVFRVTSFSQQTKINKKYL